MPNELLKTMTIDGVSNDTLGVGNYLNLDTNNNVEIPFEVIEAVKTVTLANNSSTNYEMLTLPATGLYFFLYTVVFPANTVGARYSTAYNITISAGLGALQRTGTSPSGTTSHSGFCMWTNLPAGAKIGLRLFQNSGTNFTNNVQLSMWAHYIQKVGGVIRRWLNALKPLSFRLERGCA